MNKKNRVLVVDDSALMRKKISDMISHSNDCEVIATARNGLDALQMVEKLRPDVITLDLQLPEMDGLTCLSHIMNYWPTPVIVLSAFTQEGSMAAIDALEYGAIDMIAKPSGVVSPDIQKIDEELLHKIRIAAQVPSSKLKMLSLTKANKLKEQYSYTPNKILVIGASTGGPRAVTYLLSALTHELSLAIIVAQHMPKYFISSFAHRLNQHCSFQVKEAQEGDLIKTGNVYIAPFGKEMTINRKVTEKGILTNILLSDTSSLLSPSIDKIFTSVASVFGSRTIGIVLTGLGKDGTKGCLKIKEFGGMTIAEDESTCIVFGMPASAISANAIDQVLPLNQIPNAILQAVSKV